MKSCPAPRLYTEERINFIYSLYSLQFKMFTVSTVAAKSIQELTTATTTTKKLHQKRVNFHCKYFSGMQAEVFLQQRQGIQYSIQTGGESEFSDYYA